MAFAAPIQFLTNNYSDPKSALQGITWYRQQNLQPLTLEMDSLLVVNMVSGKSKIPWKLQKIITQIQNMVQQQDIAIKHRLREGNGVADQLSKYANTITDKKIYFTKNKLAVRLKEFPDWIGCKFQPLE